jgi:hypothetical protein
VHFEWLFRTAASTYGIDQFIHFRMTKTDADQVNAGMKERGVATTVSEGDYSVLTAMHVTSREIARWTWQTFWWTHTPDAPTAPSAPSIAADRPAQLVGAGRHYAGCAGYEEVMPPQPNTGGANTGETVYCYNPYLEAPFSSGILPTSQPGMTTRNGQPIKTANDVGVQTNCMSCHAMAKFPRLPRNYTGARYVDLNDPIFKGVLKVDFLWSLADKAQ